MSKSSEKIIQIEASRLKPSPLLKQTGMMSRLIKREEQLAKKGGKEKPKHLDKIEILRGRYQALRDDIEANGIKAPVDVCASDDGKFGFEILDGRHRWEIAKELGLKKIPCLVHSKDDAQKVILSANLTKPMTKGALAYLSLTIHPEVALSEHGGNRGSSSTSELEITSESLAAQTGVSKGLMSQAVTLYRHFHNTKLKGSDGKPFYVPRSKAKFEDAIFTPGNGLGGVISGVIYFRDHGDKPEKKKTPTAAEKQEEMVGVFKSRVTAATRDLSKKWDKAPKAMKGRLVQVATDELLQNEEFAAALVESLQGSLSE